MLISHASKVMLNILQPKLQQYMNQEFTDVQAGFRKGRRTRDQISNICWIIEKARELQENIYFYFIDYAKTFVWTATNCGKFLKRWEYQTTLPASWQICMQVKKQQLELDMEQQTGSKSGKEYIRAVYCHPAHLTYMQIKYIMQNVGLDEVQAGIKIAGRNINNLQYTDDTTLTVESKELKSLLMKVKAESEKAGLKLSTQKTKRSWHPVPSVHGK